MERRVHYNKIKWPIHACVIKCKVGSRFFMWHKISDLAFKIFESWKIKKLSFFLQIWCYNSSPPALFSSPKLAIMVAQSDLKLKKKKYAEPFWRYQLTHIAYSVQIWRSMLHITGPPKWFLIFFRFLQFWITKTSPQQIEKSEFVEIYLCQFGCVPCTQKDTAKTSDGWSGTGNLGFRFWNCHEEAG